MFLVCTPNVSSCFKSQSVVSHASVSPWQEETTVCKLCDRTVRAMYITHHMREHLKKTRKEEKAAKEREEEEEQEEEEVVSRTSTGRVQRKAASKWVSD